MYIQCDQCDSWYHTNCVKLSDEEATTIDKWLCQKCFAKSSSFKNRGDKQEKEVKDETDKIRL